MTKEQLAHALKRAKEINNDSTRRPSDAIARAYGYLERAVEEYTGFDRETAERQKLSHHRINY